MVKRGVITKQQKKLSSAQSTYPQLKKYITELPKVLKKFDYVVEFDWTAKGKEVVNFIYPVSDQLFIHVYKVVPDPLQYVVIEPTLEGEGKRLYEKILDKLIELAYQQEELDTAKDITPTLLILLDKIVSVGKPSKIKQMFNAKILLTEREYMLVKYQLIRERVGFSKLEPLFHDPYLEDIHCTGVGKIKAIHKIFGAVRMSLEFETDIELNKYILDSSERVGRPVSDMHPVVDAVMPDGSRVNYIYSREISREGSSFTIRKFSDVPVSIIEIVNYSTVSPDMAAYIWLCLENGMNMFVCGETASGKTTTLNASCAFIKPDDKVYTVENTAEVTIPHDMWQHLVTREAGKETDVTIFDLLIAALRSRPNYIIVGEIRGVEGNVAFQAMQTGHPVMSTFHAGSVHSMIQRLTGHPIDVPISFIDNLNVVLIQQAVSVNGKFVRRVTSVSEIERYYDKENKVVTRQVFNWDSVADKQNFRGYFNSFILEKKIATKLGFENPKDIYKELNKRSRIISKMKELKIFNYYKVWDIISKYSREGDSSLPFEV